MDVCIRTLFGAPAAVALTRPWPKGALLALEGYRRSVRAGAKVSVDTVVFIGLMRSVSHIFAFRFT